MRIEERRVAVALGVLLALAAALFPAVARALLSDHAYWIQIYIWILFFAMCATAWNIIGGFAGQYSFGHAAFLGIGAYTSTLLYLNLGVSPWLGMVVGGVVAALAGAVISYPCFRLRGAFFSLATIAFAEMLRVGGELTDSVFGILDQRGARARNSAGGRQSLGVAVPGQGKLRIRHLWAAAGDVGGRLRGQALPARLLSRRDRGRRGRGQEPRDRHGSGQAHRAPGLGLPHGRSRAPSTPRWCCSSRRRAP